MRANGPDLKKGAVEFSRRLAWAGPVSAISSSPPSTLVDQTFCSMEEVNEISRALGQQGEFRQLGKGRVAADGGCFSSGITHLPRIAWTNASALL